MIFLLLVGRTIWDGVAFGWKIRRCLHTACMFPWVANGEWESNHIQAIWEPLVAGYTVGWTQDTILELLDLGEIELWVADKHPAQIEDWRLMAAGDLTLYDSVDEHGCARIKSVYTFTKDDPPIGWYFCV